MWILKIIQKKEILPGVYEESVFFRQYFVDEDADKAQKLANEINEDYKTRGFYDIYLAKAVKCGLS